MTIQENGLKKWLDWTANENFSWFSVVLWFSILVTSQHFVTSRTTKIEMLLKMRYFYSQLSCVLLSLCFVFVFKLVRIAGCSGWTLRRLD